MSFDVDIDYEEDIVLIAVDQLAPSPNNPRVSFAAEQMAELVEDVRQHGVLQPLMARPLAAGGYEIVFGHRRHAAARAAGLERVPCIVRQYDDADALELTITENLQREDLSAVEEARGFKKLREARGWTQAQLGEHLGKSQAFIANRERLLALPDELQQAIIAREIMPATAAVVAAVKDPPKDVSVDFQWGKYRVRRKEDFWRMARGGVSQHDLESAIDTYQRQCEAGQQHIKSDANIKKLVENTVAKVEKEYPGHKLHVMDGRQSYGWTPDGTIDAVNTTGGDWGSGICADCRACPKTQIAIIPPSYYYAGEKADVRLYCPDRACNTITKAKYQALAKQKERGKQDSHTANKRALRELDFSHDEAWEIVARYISTHASGGVTLNASSSAVDLAHSILASEYERAYREADRKELLKKYGITPASTSAAKSKPAPPTPNVARCADCGATDAESEGRRLVGAVCSGCFAERWYQVALVDVRAIGREATHGNMGRPIAAADVAYMHLIFKSYERAFEQLGRGVCKKVDVAGSGDNQHLGVYWDAREQPGKAKGLRVVDSLPDFPPEIAGGDCDELPAEATA